MSCLDPIAELECRCAMCLHVPLSLVAIPPSPPFPPSQGHAQTNQYPPTDQLRALPKEKNPLLPNSRPLRGVPTARIRLAMYVPETSRLRLGSASPRQPSPVAAAPPRRTGESYLQPRGALAKLHWRSAFARLDSSESGRAGDGPKHVVDSGVNDRSISSPPIGTPAAFSRFADLFALQHRDA